MALNIPWDWLSVGEAVYLLNSPKSRLEETLADLSRKRAPHPRAAMIVSMMFCVTAWPAFFGFFVIEAVRAAFRGFWGGK
jgi:hypothetical protein